MKKKLLYTTIISLLVFGGYKINKNIKDKKAEKAHQEWVKTLKHTASANVHILTDTINIGYLDEKRTLAVYLPEGYDLDTTDYSVIYFLDGQSLFDKKIQEGMEWEVDNVLDSLGKLGQEQSIIVGIYNSERRMKEYKPFPSTKIYSDWTVSGDKHADWIVKDLKPWIDKKYRTKSDKENTYIAGASLGGLMSYYMVMEYVDVFGGAIVFSPSFWVNPKVYELHKKHNQFKDKKIYFNAGELETPTVESIQKMEKVLLEAGMPQENIKLDVEKELGHWHITWKEGFPKAYPWLVR